MALGGSIKTSTRAGQESAKQIFEGMNMNRNTSKKSGMNTGRVGGSTDSEDEFAPLTLQNTIEMLEKSKFTTRLLEHQNERQSIINQGDIYN